MVWKGSAESDANSDSRLVAQWLSGPRWREAVWAASTPMPVFDVPAPHVTRPGIRLGAVLGGLGVTLKQAARLIYLSPLFIVAKLVLRSIDPPSSDVVVVVFVLLVVAFFALLNAYLLLAAAVFIARRGRHRAVRPATLGARALLRQLPWSTRPDPLVTPLPAREGEPPGTVMRAVGTVTAISGSGGDAATVRDRWITRGDRALRLVGLRDFAVVPDEGVPVVLHFRAAPFLVSAATTQRSAAEALAELPPGLRDIIERERGLPDGRGRSVEAALHEGDRVTVVGVLSDSIADVEQFELDGRARSLSAGTPTAQPYRSRAGRPGLRFECAFGRPALIVQSPHTV